VARLYHSFAADASHKKAQKAQKVSADFVPFVLLVAPVI
jgi:hypothetical protein